VSGRARQLRAGYDAARMRSDDVSVVQHQAAMLRGNDGCIGRNREHRCADTGVNADFDDDGRRAAAGVTPDDLFGIAYIRVVC